MPLYFFHIRNPDNTVARDDEGVGFDSLPAARIEAVASLRDLIADGVKRGAMVRGFAIDIANETGTVLESVNATEVLV